MNKRIITWLPLLVQASKALALAMGREARVRSNS